MIRKTILALVALASIGGAAVVPTTASAHYYGYGYYNSYDYGYYYAPKYRTYYYYNNYYRGY